jgi:inhibitor of cysteine peptidase
VDIKTARSFASEMRAVACILWAVFPLAMMPLAGCQDANRLATLSEDKTLAEVALTQADNGKSVTMDPGETLQITLNENPSTGFRWALEGADNKILELLNSEYVPAAGLVPGGGGEHVWRFRAKNTGEARVVLKHWRSWEGDKSIVERLEFTIQVRG